MGPHPPDPRRIAFLGLGLIGGSLAMALRAGDRAAAGAPGSRPTAPRLVAWTPAGQGPARARELGIIDEIAPSAAAAIEGADLIVLAGPPLATLDHLASLAGPWRGVLDDGAVVTDVASTKAAIVASADSLGLRFVGGHPMAGREATGLDAGSATLFVGRPWVVVAGRSASPGDVAVVERLARRTGASPVGMAAADHDAAVAAISHLPLVVAAALVEAIAGGADWPSARTLAASGWQDTTRLARGDPEMGAGILATNADLVAQRLAALRDVLDAWIAALRPTGAADGASAPGPDATAIRDRLRDARAALLAASEPEG